MIQYQRIYPETTLLRLFTLVDAAEFKGVVRGYDLVRNRDGISFYNPQIQNLYANEGLKQGVSITSNNYNRLLKIIDYL